VSGVHELVSPLRVLVSVALHDVVREVHAGFVLEFFPGVHVELTSEESGLRANFLSSFTSIFDLETRAEESKVGAKAEMEFEQLFVDGDSSHEHELARCQVIFNPLSVAVLVKVGSVLRELFLRVNVLEGACGLPPLGVGLDHDVVGLQFLDELLGALSEHS